MIVAFGSRKASPGVTTFTALVAAFWDEPGTTRLIMEADPSGGTLAARWQSAHSLTWNPGLLALSAHRGTLNADTIPSLAQPLADGLFLAAAPPSPHQIGAALKGLGDQGATDLAGAAGLRVFADCGRLNAGSSALPVVRRAALNVLVCRPLLEEVHTLLPAVDELRDAGCVVGLVCVGDGPYSAGEIADHVGIELLGAIPNDPKGAGAFARAGLAAGRSFDRSILGRTMGEVAAAIQSRCLAEATPDATTDAVPTSDSPAMHASSPGPVGFAALVGGDQRPSTNGSRR